MLLVVTSKLDSHADHLIRRLPSDFPVLRLNTDDFIEDYALNLRLSDKGCLDGSIMDHYGHQFHFNSPAVGWYRKPSFDHIRIQGDPLASNLIRSEVKSFFSALCALPGIDWLNKPSSMFAAQSKLAQLLLAKELGFSIPATIITNLPSAAQGFIDREASVITKSIYSAAITNGNLEYTCVTQRVPRNIEHERVAAVSLCPTQFQAEIEKECEYRVTVVGQKVFSCRIDSQLYGSTRVDWRVNASACEHRLQDLPEWVNRGCIEIVRRSGLEFGAIDIILSTKGEYVFLENNPGGQYLWIELKTGADITGALIDVFQEKSRGALRGKPTE